MRFHKVALVLSVLCIVASLLLVFTKKLNFGIDFAGGVLVEVKIDDAADIADLRSIVDAEIRDAQIQNVSDGSASEKLFLIRVAKFKDDDQAVLVKTIQEVIAKKYTKVEYRKIDYVGPQVGSELIRKGFLALFTSLLAIMIYIWIRFDWQFGVGGVFALLHDVFLVLGFYSISGLEFNLTSIAAILTVIGYSINDSVVIYDRIRENLAKHKKMALSQLINSSINSTLSRTILTSGVTLAAILALVIFGGEVLKSFSVATFVGILIGTYSSIYISAPILLYFDPKKKAEEKNGKK